MTNRVNLIGSTKLRSLACCGCLLLATAAQAHFPWIVLPEANSREFSVVFSEGPLPDDPQYLARLGRGPAEILLANGSSCISVISNQASASMTENENHEEKVDRASAMATNTIQDLPELPIGITSFGAARCNDAIYIYGGHTGEAHHYWNESQSNELWKWDLKSDTPQWEVIAKGPRLQGLGMVSRGQYLIIVGGFTATNEQGDSHALFSQTDVKVFDTTTNQWTDKLNLPELPEGRSSHDAMIVKDRLYVVGGWKMDGENPTEWHDTGLVADLTSANPSWETMPSPEFSRRAVTLAEFQNQLWVIGGMQQRGGPTLAVSIFEPATGRWSEGPSLIGESGMTGFGVAAWSLQGKLMVSAHDGSLQVLSDDRQRWERIGYTRDTRFFHRMLPLDDARLITLGGASMDSGKFLRPELVSLEK